MSDRAPRRRDLTKPERDCAERRRKAWETAFAQFPQLRVGTELEPSIKRHPCPWLVWAICNVSATGGPLKRAAVLAERRRLLPRHDYDINEEKAA